MMICVPLRNRYNIFIEKYLNGIWVPNQIDGALYVLRLKKNAVSVSVCNQKDIMVIIKDAKKLSFSVVAIIIVGYSLRE